MEKFNYKKWYEINKVGIIEKGCAKIECYKCGKMTSKNNMSNHMKTSLCLRTIAHNKEKKLYLKALFLEELEPIKQDEII